MADLLKTQIPQLVISVLVIIGIFVLLALRVITPADPLFVAGGSSLLVLIIGYWLSVGQQRIQHTHTIEALRQAGGDDAPKLTTRPTVTDWNKFTGGH